MDLIAIHKAMQDDDWAALWRDLIKSLPKCRECGAPSVHVEREYPQNPPQYLCARTACHDANGDEGFEPAPWADHVLAYELRRGK
ncbi:MAG TPA: hypothetical protein VNI01_01510 [Elusimicrobiota bacterium]|nr:hypothetical protein [Elusimicrobiota bacterium]